MVVRFKNHEIELYDSIQNLPIKRFQKMNKYQMMASDVGCDFNDYKKRTDKAIAFLHKNMVKEALDELENRALLVFNAYSEFSPSFKSFAVMVKRIDKVVYHDYAPNDLDVVLERLNEIGFDAATMMDSLIEVKKKINSELSVYFPKSFPKNPNPEETALRAKRINALADSIIEDDKEKSEIEIYNIEKEILEGDKPNIWNVWLEGNMERQIEVDFEKFGIAIMELTGGNLEQTSTFEFYAKVEHLTEKHKPKTGK